MNREPRWIAPELDLSLSADWVAARSSLLRRLPDCIADALDRATATAQHHQLPVAILRPRDYGLTDALAVMTLSDFARWVLGHDLPKEQHT